MLFLSMRTLNHFWCPASKEMKVPRLVKLHFLIVFPSISKLYFHHFWSCISIYFQFVFPSISKLYFSDFQSLCLALDWHSNPGSERKSQGWSLCLQPHRHPHLQRSKNSQTSRNSFTILAKYPNSVNLKTFWVNCTFWNDELFSPVSFSAGVHSPIVEQFTKAEFQCQGK